MLENAHDLKILETIIENRVDFSRLMMAFSVIFLGPSDHKAFGVA